ncbi:glycoside hydrolase family 16 protein [Nocardioides piscis]|uniref:Glycoside hydrolase family 16 protein n=1 Tax=Nocardioides piscis TaxID=2714938 RepID=A0A6G7YCX9_9ACTN|nr:glycoside hydrolase family 16 protein [Nocardioides piscis]QIK74579.1 glycoside hydrolase family 16 protein [Nocardioides piscis]
MPLRRSLLGGTSALVLSAALLGGANPGAAGDDAAPELPASTSLVTDGGQQVRLQVLPQVVQQGPRVADPDTARAALTATVEPVRVGRRIRLQVQVGTAWTSVAIERQDARGRVEFAAPAARRGQPLTYRVKAAKIGGLAAVESGTVSTSRWTTPTWTDEFSGTALSPDWSFRGLDYEEDSLRRCSKAGVEAVRVARGAVRLSVVKDPARTTKCKARKDGKVVGKYAYRLNGHIGTQGGFDFTYGVAAARIKFHRSRGQHGAFWMQPVSGNYPGSPGHEIDIIEYFGDHHPRGGLTSFIHRYEDGVEVRRGARVANFGSFLAGRRDGWSKNFHVFSVEWTPRLLVFRIDGRETGRIRGGISSVAQYPILSLLASDYEIPHMRDRQLPQHMYVDWIRVWETGS